MTDPSRRRRRIDRRAVVSRHDPVKRSPDPAAPLQVGNGAFAFGVDVTGLQSLPDHGTNTLSDWGWHTAPPPDGAAPDDFGWTPVESHGRTLRYPLISDDRAALGDWLRRNPHRLDLGRIALRTDRSTISPDAVDAAEQTLDLWTGTIDSTFELQGQPVHVETRCHPYRDTVAVRIESPLVASGDASVAVAFPYADDSYHATDVGVWDRPDAHETTVDPRGDATAVFRRELDGDAYTAALSWEGGATLERRDAHTYALSTDGGDPSIAFVCRFSPGHDPDPPRASQPAVARACEEHWPAFWRTGAAIDLSGSDDPRWEELERRVVLSQYLLAVNAAGSSPPQESGLVCNTWHGKFHLEMTLWHGLQFALWDRPYLLDGWLEWFEETGLPAARRNAEQQGCEGARWQKMIAAGAEWESPHWIGPLRETQQGHAIYWMEHLYRLRPDRDTLDRYKELVFETADYMADAAAWDEETERYVLGPPIISGAEATDGLASWNPTVELSYWRYGLETAQRWRERLGLPRNESWDAVLADLSEPPTDDGVYVNLESHADNWATTSSVEPRSAGWAGDVRPAWLEAYGCMPGVGIDPETMARTFDRVTADLDQWGDLWGVDFPMFAMTAARLGRPRDAVDFLLAEHPNNTFRANGCNVMPGGPAYLPGNGGLLWAVAMMAAGWDGGPDHHAPGFPDDDWTVRYEGLRPPQ